MSDPYGQQLDLGPEEINAILTFEAQDGRRWLCGAQLGPLLAEDDTTTTMSIFDTLDTVMTLVSFRVVNRG